MSTRASIIGVSGTELTAAWRAFVRAEGTWDFIPFRFSFEVLTQATVQLRELNGRQLIAADPAGRSIPVDGAANPVHQVPTSATMIAQVIRSAVGFQGLLMSNDVPMKTLAGRGGEANRAMLAAGAPRHSNDNAQLDALSANTASA
ncbi:hypothetical protein [Bradyrhizobium guangzhouense]|uniref:Uncharacterized protein n=1 Tax=Bradyrhizobium guangzhouense TaxID=1325095 RepID=A0AAE5X1C2_9BRAD|nr:hypothetical protein [Bradyrhizobium guangzhouense]QAU46909.1 hypothetical protein XH91_17120 [Bradyrhizobium guangzhouense]RXH12803.1 hypothetical protein EAS54_25610 [Bradyrhizobium guangzhouense]RXH12986.1 hypothetical protein EAS56_15935 [Bradyrhizobium guangzhouense]